MINFAKNRSTCIIVLLIVDAAVSAQHRTISLLSLLVLQAANGSSFVVCLNELKVFL